MLQSAARRISLVVIPLANAEEAPAPLVEWVLKTEVSAPASCNTVFNHLAIDDDVTGECGLIQDKKIFEDLAFPGG